MFLVNSSGKFHIFAVELCKTSPKNRTNTGKRRQSGWTGQPSKNKRKLYTRGNARKVLCELGVGVVIRCPSLYPVSSKSARLREFIRRPSEATHRRLLCSHKIVRCIFLHLTGKMAYFWWTLVTTQPDLTGAIMWPSLDSQKVIELHASWTSFSRAHCWDEKNQILL